jgi:hypothetical protein
MLFAEKTLKLLNDASRMATFAKAARRTAERFSVDETAKQLEQIYQTMIDAQATRKRSVTNLEEFRKLLTRAKTQIKTFSDQI